MPLLVPLIAAGASVASSLLTNRANKKRQDEMNEYNSPVSQLERYKKAGINPGYGSGVSTGNQSSIVQASAPDIGGAVDAGAKAISWKSHYLDIKTKELELEKTAAQIKNQNLVNALAEQTLHPRVEMANTQANIMTYQKMSNQFEAGSKEIDLLWKKALDSKGYNPQNQDFLYKKSATAANEIANMLKNQSYKYNEKSQPLEYQLNQQKFEQAKILNPLRVIVERLRSEGIRDSDPLMIRLMALQYLAGKPMLQHKLMPAAAGAAVSDPLLKMLKF